MLTFSPCPASTCAVKIMCSEGKTVFLPKLTDPVLYFKHIEEQRQRGVENVVDPLADDMHERREIRLNYPGACSLVYQDIAKCVIDILIGWDPST